MVAAPARNGPRSAHAFRANRPSIWAGGQERTALASGLVRLSIAESVDGITQCEATFTNWGVGRQGIGFLYFDRELLDFGKAFQIKVGAGSDAILLFDGRIMAIEASFPRQRTPEITILVKTASRICG